MRTRSRPETADVISRRLEQLRAELATQWQPPDPSDEPAPTQQAEDSWWDPHTHVPAADDASLVRRAVAPEPAPPRGEADVPAALVPVPGRHVARRRLSLRLGVPAPLRGRVALSPWHLALVAVGVAVALIVTCWWVIRSDATSQPVAPLASGRPLASLSSAPQPATTPGVVATPSASAASAGSAASPGAGASAGRVTVDVEGKVRRPGIAVLPNGSRVVDAIRAAGGAPHRRDLAGLNLAAVLTDGQQIVVGGPAATGPSTVPGAVPGASPGSSPGSASPGAPGELVNLNTATLDDLEALPDVGPVTAQSILDWREENGGFTSVDELLEVDGIGPVTMQKLTPLVTV